MGMGMGQPAWMATNVVYVPPPPPVREPVGKYTNCVALEQPSNAIIQQYFF